MKKIILFAFSLIAFLFFGAIGVDAGTGVTINNLQDYLDAIGTSGATELKLGTNLDLSTLNSEGNEDAIYVNRNIVFDLNGHTLTTGAASIKVWYYGDYTFTITDSSANHTGEINLTGGTTSRSIKVENITNCNPKMILEDITINAEPEVGRIIFFVLPSAGYHYTLEINGTKFNNAKTLFEHFYSDNQVLDIKISSMVATRLQYINIYRGYKVKDILNPITTELLIDDVVVDDPERVLSGNSDQTLTPKTFVIRTKRLAVSSVSFEESQYGYSIASKPITINNIGLSPIKVKSVTVNDPSKFTIIGNTQPTIEVGNTDNTSFAIKPNNGLGLGSHTATITVTDINDNTCTSIVTFSVIKANITPIVSIKGWYHSESANAPSVTGNIGNGYVIYSYKVQGAADSTYTVLVPTAVGKYTVRANVYSTANYNSESATADFSIDYKVTDGNGQKHTIGKIEDSVFKIDADNSLFDKVYLNNEELNREHYLVTEGSTIITLKKDYLNTLLAGTYNLKATFTDGGEANATFVIAKSVENNPQTGDSIIISMIIGGISLLGLLALGIYKRKNA